MALLRKKKKMEWYYVYRGINHNKKEVYFGVSKDPLARRDGSHCQGGTVALNQWNCSNHKILWYFISKHKTQQTASAMAHHLEKNYKHPQEFKVIKTAGI